MKQKHYSKRLEERFNIEIDKKSLKKLNLNIQGIDNSIPCLFVGKKSNRVSLWLILVNNRWAIAYYDKSRNTIVTFVYNSILDNINLIEKCLNNFQNKKLERTL